MAIYGRTFKKKTGAGEGIIPLLVWLVVCVGYVDVRYSLMFAVEILVVSVDEMACVREGMNGVCECRHE